LRPVRLFGFDGTTDEAPRFPAVFKDLGTLELSPATAPGILPGSTDFKLQGDPSAPRLRREEVLLARRRAPDARTRRNAPRQD